jgi:hypothetical protein
MSALLFIAEKRRVMERIDLAMLIRTAMNAGKQDFQKAMDRLAKSAEIDLRWEE